ncbi:DNA polymerase III subunit gamma and tau [Amycolatopsis dendrobii]|uniref:DNA polymerase III subunit gamma/tau n=1 Tax=Amycolatopsis dendrobii TaxID=2760662 RepID=A0A7W3ZCA3_9PSEU|nr:DNA polymerase III subunit gamma and tau [Amycolatopsis dendrobii]MBB1155639.1 DNA polymerase III subunit gamma and tau [Amycolatopsis dendrobii]
MALALYRKYRPATFAEVVGQEHVTEPLRTALAAGRINHAYLFSGPRGCGKTSSARIMARSLNCAKGPTPDPCGECNSCRALAPEGPGSVDVTELDAASHGGVDDARELRDKAFYAPAESRYRVFIIDEAHMVTTQGFNALLKIVEEPPEHLIFIFATTEPDKVLTTIRSRTHHYPFRLIPPSSMRELLERNVAAEGATVEPAVYPLVIRAGGGSARDTQSVLDQLLAGAGPEGVTYPRAVSLLGVTDTALIDAVIDGLANDNPAEVFGTVEKLADAGHDPRRFATDLLDRLRDLLLMRAVPEAGERGLVAAPDDELKRMTEQAEKLGPATLSRYADIVHSGLLEMRGATSPRLVLELLCARMLLPSVTEAEKALLARIERLERRPAGAPAAAGPAVAPGPPPAPAAGPAPVAAAAPAEAPARSFQRPSQRPAQEAPAAPARPAAEEPARPARPEVSRPAPAEPPAPAQQPAPVSEAPAAAPVAEEAPVAGGIDAAKVREKWPQLLASLRKFTGGRALEAMLTQATVAEVDGSAVTLTHKSEPLARRLSDQGNASKIAAGLSEVLGGEWQVRCVHGAAAAAAPARQAPRQQPAAPAPERSFTRPSAAAQAPAAAAPAAPPKPAAEAPSRPRVTTSEPDIPLPPEPADEDDDIYSEDSSPVPPPPPPPAEEDPEQIARKLLSDHLGARPLD